ncbi:type III PLP-dependent enzyme [Streptomyces sp. NPDC088812]|uniref:type III PLP-dependent enzyme n=1 Tax=Streptomyces sp. NPDC088812 TaxID=3365905 RepID=UPI0037F9145C
MSDTAAGPGPTHAYHGPTPAYVYDLATVRAAHDRLRSCLPAPSELYYSVKANPHPEVVATLLGRGCRAEVSSAGELRTALAAGVRPQDVLYTGPGKSDAEVGAALAAGVRLFSLDSAHAVRQLAAQAARHGTTAGYLLRVNPDRAATATGLTMTGLPSPFGADLDSIRHEPSEFTRHPRAVCRGLHLYLATNLADEQALTEQFLIAVETAVRVRDILGIRLETLDLGGGFAAPYAREGELPDYPLLAGRLAAALDGAFPGWREGRPGVAFEAGRYLTATCGRLYGRVLDVKHSHGRRVMVLDTGIHHLGGMAGLKRVPPIRPQVVTDPDTAPAVAADEATMVCGPLCTPLDTWAGGAHVAAGEPGDLVHVPNVGAYGLSASLALFLGHPLPLEVVTDGRRHLGTTRLTLHRTAITVPETTTSPKGTDDGDHVHRTAPAAPAFPAR